MLALSRLGRIRGGGGPEGNGFDDGLPSDPWVGDLYIEPPLLTLARSKKIMSPCRIYY